jgi:hypothetical protein
LIRAACVAIVLQCKTSKDGEVPMTDHSASRSASTRPLDHVTVLLAAHRRLVDAMLRCSDIVARTGRDCLEGQIAVADSVLRGLMSAGMPAARAVTSGGWPSAGERMSAIACEVATQLTEMRGRLFEAQVALLREVTDALVGEPAGRETAPPVAAEAAMPTESEAAPVESPPAERRAATAEPEPADGEAAKARRARRTVVAG